MKLFNIRFSSVYKTILIVIVCIIIGNCDKKTPEPSLEPSGYTGEPRIVFLSSSISDNTVSGIGVAGGYYTFTLRAQSKAGIILIKLEALTLNNKTIDNNDNMNITTSQIDFSNVNITDYAGSLSLRLPVDTSNNFKIKATLIDKDEHRETAYFMVSVEKTPIKTFFNLSSSNTDSITILKANVNSSKSIYLIAESKLKIKYINYKLYKKSMIVKIPQYNSSSFELDDNEEFYYYNIILNIKDTGIYVLKSETKNERGIIDTSMLTIQVFPPKLYSRFNFNIGAQNNTALGISYIFIAYDGDISVYKYKEIQRYPSTLSTFSYVEDNGTPYLASLFERKNANFYGDSLPVNTQDSRFIELPLPVSAFDTLSENYIYSLQFPSTSPGKINISTNKLVGYQDVQKNKGVVRINSFVVGSTGSMNFDVKNQAPILP